MRNLCVLFILLYVFYYFEFGISSCLPDMLPCYFIGPQSLRWPPLPPILQFKLLSCDHITQWQSQGHNYWLPSKREEFMHLEITL